MSLPQTPQEAALRHIVGPLARVGDASLGAGLLTALLSWSGFAPGSWLWPALLLVVSGYTVATIARSELRGVAADEVVSRLSRSAEPELMQFRAEVMQPPRHPIVRFWAGVGPTPAKPCRWRIGHARCDGYLAELPPQRERLCSCNCHENDALGLTGTDHASLWLAGPERFQRARRRSLRADAAGDR